MKILLIPALWGDFNLGLERTLSAIIDGLNQRGFAVDVAVRKRPDLDRVRNIYNVELSDLNLREVPGWGSPAKRVPLIGSVLSGLLERRGFGRLTSEYDLAIVQSATIPPASAAKRSVLFTEFPRDPVPSSRDWKSRLSSYDLLIGNSAFTCGWIERYWQHPTEVFYPSIQECEPLDKEPLILGVGRFTRGGREKGQVEMVETFRTMVDGGLEGWRLALAGFTGAPDYIAAVRNRAGGYPVDLHIGASGEELKNLYGRSSLFWHTTGLGADLEREPQRFEHFGIVVAEAMTAGCVPLVFGAAGPKEITDDPKLCWQDLDQLRMKTMQLIDEPEHMRALSVQCRTSAVARFGHTAFDRSIERLLGTGS